MNLASAVILGLVQGLAEFLPISSSGHLVLFKDILGLSEVPLLFDIVLHLATLGAVLLIFRKRIASILVALWRWLGRKSRPEDVPALAMVWPLILATLVTAAIGFAIEAAVPAEGSRIVAVELLITAAVLGASAFIRQGARGYRDLNWKDGLGIGLAQGLGVFSGISRSGFTISAGLARGLGRAEAGEFSFLLSIPAILGAFLLELKDAADLSAQVDALPLALSALVAFVSGIFALKVLMRVVRGGKLAWFALYLLFAGTLGLVLAS